MILDPRLRYIGDPILHQPGLLVPVQTDSSLSTRYMAEADVIKALTQQIEIAKALLIDTGGLGIAANQCADIAKPYQFAIVGIYHEIKAHTDKVLTRYPSLIFPEAMLIVNPIVVASSENQQVFRHGCLSIPGKLRADLLTPESITLAYLRFDGKYFYSEQQVFTGLPAVILQHELNHILYGLTYFDCCLSYLSRAEQQNMSDLLTKMCSNRVEPQARPETSDEYDKFLTIDKQHHVCIDSYILERALQYYPLTIRHAFQQRLASS